jgi:hypothetical protein
MTPTGHLLAALGLTSIVAIFAGLVGDHLIHAPKPVPSAVPECTATDAAERSYERLLDAVESSGEQLVLLPTPEYPRFGNPPPPPDRNDVAMDSLPHPIPPGALPTSIEEARPAAGTTEPPCKPRVRTLKTGARSKS